MAGTTTINALRYATLTDPPNAQTSFKNLADDVDTRIVPRFASAAARDTAITSPVEGMVCDVASTGLMRYSGSAWVNVSRVQSVMKELQTGRNSTTTCTDDPDLILPYISGKKYIFKTMLYLNSLSTAADFKVQVKTNATSYVIGRAIGPTTGSTSSPWTINATGFSTTLGSPVPMSFGAYSATPDTPVVDIEGSFIATTSSNLSIQWAQNTSDANHTYVLDRSWLRLEEV